MWGHTRWRGAPFGPAERSGCSAAAWAGIKQGGDARVKIIPHRDADGCSTRLDIGR